MRVAFRFHKKYAEKVLDALRAGMPILPLESTGWTLNSIMTVAGILHAAAIAAAAAYNEAEASGTGTDTKQAEEREKIGEALRSSYATALDFLSMLAMKLITEEYDREYGAEVTAVVDQTPDGSYEVSPAHDENQ